MSNRLTENLQTPDTFREHVCQIYVREKVMNKAGGLIRWGGERNFAGLAAFHRAAAGLGKRNVTTGTDNLGKGRRELNRKITSTFHCTTGLHTT
jgi:hypothetical protein